MSGRVEWGMRRTGVQTSATSGATDGHLPPLYKVPGHDESKCAHESSRLVTSHYPNPLSPPSRSSSLKTKPTGGARASSTRHHPQHARFANTNTHTSRTSSHGIGMPAPHIHLSNDNTPPCHRALLMLTDSFDSPPLMPSIQLRTQNRHPCRKSCRSSSPLTPIF